MSPAGPSRDAPGGDATPPVLLDPRAEALLRRLLQLDAVQVRQIRASLPPRRRPAGLTGPSADLGDDRRGPGEA